MRRSMWPWFIAPVAWLLGVAWQTGAGGLWPVRVYAVVCGLAGLVLVGWPWWRPRWPDAVAWRRGAVGLCAVAVALLAWGSTAWRAAQRLDEALPAGWAARVLTVEVDLEGLPRAAPGSVLVDAQVVRWLDPGDGPAVASGHGLPRHLSLRMPVRPGAPAPRPGQRWQVAVRLHAPDGLSNPGGRDPTLASFERGVRAVGKVLGGPGQAVCVSEQAGLGWRARIDRWRQDARARIFARVADARVAGVLAGLAVGDQSAIGQDQWTLFRDTGVTHLVVISGAHIALFGWLVAGIVRRLWARWPWAVHHWPASDVALWSAVLACVLYALLAGWGVPAQRTVWMALSLAWLRGGGRRWPWPLVCLGSAVVLSIWDPWALRQAGFYLSYGAVAVLLSSPRGPGAASEPAAAPHAGAGWRAAVLRGLPRLWAVALALVQVQWRLTVALLPLTLVCFQQASLSGLLANLVAIPFFSAVITPLALLGLVWPFGWDLARPVVEALLAGLGALAQAWPAMVSAPELPAAVAALAVLAGFAAVWPWPWRWRLGLLPFVLPLCCLPLSWQLWPPPKPGAFNVLAADVGQGTAVLVRTAHHSLLFDTGPRIGAQMDAGQRVLLPLLRALAIGRIDLLVISHQDNDHVGGASAIVGAWPVSRLLSSLADDHPLLAQAGLTGRPLPHTACEAGQRWRWDGVLFEVLHPGPQAYAHRQQRPPNAMSCVLKVSAEGPSGASVLLTGDIEAAQEQDLLTTAGPRLRSTVLFAPHHGSHTSSTAAFLRAVRPARVVIQVGRRNRYGHPAPEVLARYRALGLPWVASPACGAYFWSSVQAERGQCWRRLRPHYWRDDGSDDGSEEGDEAATGGLGQGDALRNTS